MASSGAPQGLRGSLAGGREVTPELVPPREDMSQESPSLASCGEEVLWAAEGVFWDKDISESRLLLASAFD